MEMEKKILIVMTMLVFCIAMIPGNDSFPNKKLNIESNYSIEPIEILQDSVSEIKNFIQLNDLLWAVILDKGIYVYDSNGTKIIYFDVINDLQGYIPETIAYIDHFFIISAKHEKLYKLFFFTNESGKIFEGYGYIRHGAKIEDPPPIIFMTSYNHGNLLTIDEYDGGNDRFGTYATYSFIIEDDSKGFYLDINNYPISTRTYNTKDPTKLLNKIYITNIESKYFIMDEYSTYKYLNLLDLSNRNEFNIKIPVIFNIEIINHFEYGDTDFGAVKGIYNNCFKTILMIVLETQKGVFFQRFNKNLEIYPFNKDLYFKDEIYLGKFDNKYLFIKDNKLISRQIS